MNSHHDYLSFSIIIIIRHLFQKMEGYLDIELFQGTESLQSIIQTKSNLINNNSLKILMFLTKKTAHLTQKPKHSQNNKPKKALAGWGDDEEPQQSHPRPVLPKQKPTIKPINLLEIEDKKESFFNSKQQIKSPTSIDVQQVNIYYTWDQLNDNHNIQCQKRLVEEIVQPGGIRIKPNQSNLSEFLKQAKSMQVPNIGSLLLSKLEVNYPFAVKAKALYTIEFIAKKNTEYMNYFKSHSNKFTEFPEPEDNVESYRKILKSVLASLGLQQSAVIEEKQKYVDPGYYQEPKSQLSNFIHQNVNKPKSIAPKKTIIGPGQTKSKGIDKIEKQESLQQDLVLLSLDEKDQKQKHPNVDLLQQISTKPKQTDLINL